MSYKLTKVRIFFLTCLFSVLLFLITCWSAVFQYATPYWVESIGFFLLTYICAEEFSKRLPDINVWIIVLAVVLGQLIVQIPFRVTDFFGGLGSIMIVVSCIMATVLAILCYKDKRPYTFILSYVVLSLFNSFVAETWNNYVLELMARN